MAKGGVQAERLKSFIERIERLEEERAATSGDIREVYAEAKSSGYDTKVMRQIVRLRDDEAVHARLLNILTARSSITAKPNAMIAMPAKACKVTLSFRNTAPSQM